MKLKSLLVVLVTELICLPFMSFGIMPFTGSASDLNQPVVTPVNWGAVVGAGLQQSAELDNQREQLRLLQLQRQELEMEAARRAAEADQRERLRVLQQQKQELDMRAARRSFVTISASPDGVEVYENDKLIGAAPVQEEILTPRTFELRKANYFTQRGTIIGAPPYEVHAVLKPFPVITVLATPPGTQIFCAGILIGKDSVKLPVGEKIVLDVCAEHYYTESVILTPESSAQINVALKAMPNLMTISNLASAEVHINGATVVVQPVDDLFALKQKAEQGDAEAQFNLGIAYSLGNGVLKNSEEAAKWLRLSAKQGHSGAQTALGIAYISGTGISQDKKEAIRLFRLAVEQGDARAQYALGAAYAKGDGVLQDYTRAYALMNVAAAQGIGVAEKERSLIMGRMTPEQIAEGQRLSREYEGKISK